MIDERWNKNSPVLYLNAVMLLPFLHGEKGDREKEKKTMIKVYKNNTFPFYHAGCVNEI